MKPIDVLPLFPVLNDKLILLLRSLTPEQWQYPTVARQWKVKDVVTHMLDVNFRRIALHRDHWALPAGEPIHTYTGLVSFLNELNADWVKATRRLSPEILIELLVTSNAQVYDVFASLDPHAPATYAVSWAGEETSANWFDIAREYTERWHHQQQIRDAIGDAGLLTDELYFPLLDIFMQAWPVSCAELPAKEGTTLKAVITGPGGGSWFLQKQNGHWNFADPTDAVDAETIIDGGVAWKLFSKSLRKEDIVGKYEIKGDKGAAERLLEMVSVMA